MNARALCCLTLSLISLSAALPAQQRDPAVLLESARYEVQVRGDLEAAIRIFETLVKNHADRRDIAARALVELGQAYEALGRGNARDAYRRVLANYPDQREAAELARGRLAVLVESSTPVVVAESGLRLRRLWETPSPPPVGVGALSPDGRHVLFMDWGAIADPALRGHADVALYDTRAGRARRVTNRPSLTVVDVYPSAPVWSGNGKWIAYTLWATDWTHQQLHVVRPDGTEDRTVLDNRQMADARAMAFASDGAFIAALLKGWDNVWRIGLVSLKDTSLVILKTLGTHAPAALSLSPDNRFVAYAYPLTEVSEGHDIFVLSVDGAAERRIAPQPAEDVMPVWTPDGERILFVSDRSGQRALWAVGWQNGGPQGEPQLVYAHLGAMELLGVTGSGAPYFRVGRTESEVYQARLDLTGNASLSQVSRLPETHLLTNFRPAWSPDGERVAYLSRRGTGGRSPHLVVKTLATRQERAHPLQFPLARDQRVSRPDWSLDGRYVWIEGSDPENRAPGRVSFRIDVESGEVTREKYRRDFAGMTGNQITEFAFVDGRQAEALRSLGIRLGGQTDVNLFMQGDEPLRPDETLLFVRNGVQRVSLTDRKLEPLTPLGHMGHWRLSPDGKTLALAIASDSVMISNVLSVLPLSDVAARELAHVERKGDQPGRIAAVRWTPDGKHVIYALVPAGGKETNAQIWLVDATGGTPRRLDLELTPYQLGNLSFHPDGRRIAYTRITAVEEVWLAEGLPWQKTDRR